MLIKEKFMESEVIDERKETKEGSRSIEMSKPALITLDTGGYESESKRRKVDGKIRRIESIAIHCPIAHILGEPCIRILEPPKGHPPLVNGHNIFKVLEHEGIHHVMADILPDSNDDTLDAFLSNLPDGHILKQRLAFGVG